MKRALSLCVALLLLIAGCSALPPYSMHKVSVHNHQNSSVALTVEIQSEEGTVLDTSEELEPGEKWNVTTQEAAGNYTISVSTASGLEDAAEYSLPLAEDGLTSYAVVHIEPGEIDIMVYYQE